MYCLPPPLSAFGYIARPLKREGRYFSIVTGARILSRSRHFSPKSKHR
jgi:hypothetical protein